MTAVSQVHAAAPSIAQQLARLHSARGGQELDSTLDRLLGQLLPGANAALCVVGERDDCYKVRVALGAAPWRTGDTVQLDTWPAGATCRLPLRYREHEIGVFVSDRRPDERTAVDLAGLLSNIAVALVNITLNDEAQRSTEQYCASIQALEEGIVLFQENDPEAVTARLLTLAGTILGASACALYAFRDIGNRDSELVLQQCMGLPEELLYTMRPLDVTAEWPRCWLESPAFFVDRAQDAHLAGLDPGYLPPQLRNLVSLPLQYHGVVAGIIVLLNVDAGPDAISQRMERMQAVCQLAAALLHRLNLEAAHQRAARTQHEIELAATIQQRLLPRSAPQVAGLEFAWHSRAAQQIGGDYVDLVGSPAGELHAVVADVSGHGVTAGLLMGSFRSTWRAEAPRARPCDLIAALNREVCDDVGSTGMFITAISVHYRPADRTLTLANAGHNPALLHRRSSGTVQAIDSDGPPLGFADAATFGQQCRELAPGDLLLVHTDGITEATNPELEMYGDERLRRTLARLAANCTTAQQVLDALLADLHAFCAGQPLNDDLTLLVVACR